MNPDLNIEIKMTLKKVVIVGDSGVGKTSLIYKLQNRTFSGKYIPTLEFTSFQTPFQFEIEDIPGQDKFMLQHRSKPDPADCCILMFSLTSKVSYKSIKFWRSYIKNTYGDIPIVLCGNKSDVV